MSNIGKWVAKVKDVGISLTKQNLPQIAATLTCTPDKESGKAPFDFVFFGSLKGGASPITLNALRVMGYTFSVNDLSDIASGHGLDFNKEFEVVIEENTYEGKTSERIKYIGEIGAARVEKLDPTEAVQLMKGLDISGTVMSFMQDKGIKAGGASTAPTKKNFAADDIPY